LKSFMRNILDIRAPRKELGLLLGFLGMCMFAGTLPATRVALSGFEPVFLTAARGALAGTTGLLVLLVTRSSVPPRSAWLELVAGALCSVLAFPLLAALAMKTVPASHGGVVQGILPLATAAAAAIFARERPSRDFWLASAVGAAIVLAFVLRRNGGEAPSAGDVFLIGTVVAGALGYTFSGRLAARMPGWEVISWQVVALLPAALIATFLLWPSGLGPVSTAAFAGLGYVGFISQYAAFVAFNAAMAISGIARIGQIMLLQPFVIVALALPINGEPITMETIVFAAAVVVIVLIGQRAGVRRSILKH
jgi:drug/metabolite transporter (DMT)-like permease